MRHSALLAPYVASAACTLFCLTPASSSEGASYRRYAVAADHTDASRVGAAVLAQGGNAADAAAATMLALGVASPSGSGLGGGGFALYYRASDRSLTYLDFRETAPGAATAEMFRAREGDTPDVASQRSQRGGLAVGVPGEPAGVVELVRRFGRLPLASVTKPAAELAENGFSLSEHTVNMVARSTHTDPLFRSVFSEPSLAARKAKNPALARTLRRFGAEGGKLFYKGALAKQIVRTVKDNGGVLSERDLAEYKVAERTPLRATRLGFEWITAPPPSAGGYTILTSLGLLERWLPTPQHWRGSERLHALIESWKGPVLDRQYHFGDPGHVQIPLAELSAEARLEQRAARYHPLLALSGSAYDLPLGEVKPAVQPEDHGTSHLCVVDEEGNVAAVTTTVNLDFGSGLGVGGLWLNDEMDDFAREVGKPNAFGLIGGAPNLPGPGRRPVSSMSPTIVLKDGQPILCIGGSGGSRIPTAVEQVALYVLHDGMHPHEAVSAPRVHHQLAPDIADARGVSDAFMRELAARGHRVRVAPYGAQVQAIAIRQVDGERRLLAASDPGKNGEPRGE